MHVRPLSLTPCIHPISIHTSCQKNIFIRQKYRKNTCKSQCFSYVGLIALHISAEAQFHHQAKVTKTFLCKIHSNFFSNFLRDDGTVLQPKYVVQKRPKKEKLDVGRSVHHHTIQIN